MTTSLQKLLLFGVTIELIILLISYILNPDLAYTFRYAARYSGRLSGFVFLYAFLLFTKRPIDLKNNTTANNFIKLFAVVHLIHFVFLAMSVFLNKIPLETVKVIGGFLAYMMIIIAPFKLNSLKLNHQLVYFYYISLVMILTYAARIKGDFPGAEPYWFHYTMLTIFITCCFVFGISIRKSINQIRY